MRRTSKAWGFLMLWGVVVGPACSPASTQPLPRLERYDFMAQTPNDLVRLRQIAPAEGAEGALARYALARAHADWLVLGLVHERDDDSLLRRLAVDLEVPDASVDDPLTLSQVIEAISRVEAEVDEASAAGGEARRWASDVGQLFEGLRLGWEEFGAPLFRTIVELSEEPGPARLATDLLALGWARVALGAMATRPAPEQPSFLARMAGYGEIEVVEALSDPEGSLWQGSVDFGCEQSRREEGDTPRERLAAARRLCSGSSQGFSDDAGQELSPELVVAARVFRDLIERRQRVEAGREDPLYQAAVEVFAGFDAALAAVRLPLPLAVPGPRLPSSPIVTGPAAWRPTAAVVTIDEGGGLSVGLWPTLGVVDGEVRLLDARAGLALPGRAAASDLPAALTATFEAARQRLGISGRSVALLLSEGADSGQLFSALAALEGEEVESIALVVQWGEAGLGLLPIEAQPGIARGRGSSDRRALLVLRDEGVLLGTADGSWVDFEDNGGQMTTSRIAAALAGHVGGLGNASCIVAVRPGVSVARIAEIIDLLARAPRAAVEDAARGWSLWLDPEEPPAPAPVADTASNAVALHRVRLRQCYERYLRSGGRGQGQVVLSLVVGSGGTVREARIDTTELGPQPSLDNCLVSEAQRIRFPSQTAEGAAIRLPLRFVPRQ